MSGQPERRYLTVAARDLPFCPGCGHTNVLHKGLDAALHRLDLDPKKVVLVTDIGCQGLSDQYFAVHAIHGQHGRSLTYAQGVHLADPSLKVIVIMGDGGLGIGGHHLLAAARRNIGVTVLVFNNYNFGMTAGVQSPTTPEGALTSSTPHGAVEQPLDVCAVYGAAGAWAARTTTYHAEEMADVLARAIDYPGFSVVDIHEFCTAHFVPRNDFAKADMEGLLERYGLRCGVLHEPDRDDYVTACRKILPQAGPSSKGDRPAREESLAGGLDSRFELVVAGAGALWAQAAHLSGCDATLKGDFPITVMTGFSLAEIVTDPEEVLFTGIEEADALIAIDPAGMRRAGPAIEAMGPAGTIFCDTTLREALPPCRASVVEAPFLAEGRRVDRFGAAPLALGYVAAATGAVPVEALLAAARSALKPELAGKTCRAIERGAELAAGATV
jgi:pyruvate/2-oxoacid:ferredoxin oxidoreductase beta subunit